MLNGCHFDQPPELKTYGKSEDFPCLLFLYSLGGKWLNLKSTIICNDPSKNYLLSIKSLPEYKQGHIFPSNVHSLNVDSCLFWGGEKGSNSWHGASGWEVTSSRLETAVGEKVGEYSSTLFHHKKSSEYRNSKACH